MKNLNFELEAFFEITPDLVWIADKAGFLKKVNAAVIEKLGYTEEELYASPIVTFIHPEDREITMDNRKRLLEGEVLHNFINRYITKEGAILWLEWTSVYFSDKELVLAIAKDITRRKQIEKEVGDEYYKFKNLATHFKSSIEKDRKYFAYELHEELAQLASVINMDVSWLALNLPGLPEKLKNRIEHASAVSKLLIETIQRLSFSISPKMLDDFGLNATLEWLCKEYSILNGVPCNFESAYDEEHLSEEIKMDFFRICQETLNNLINYHYATAVIIRIEDVNDSVRLSILDQGKGFMAIQEEQPAGLISIRERVSSINGNLTLQHEAEKGGGIWVDVEKQYDSSMN